MITPDSILSAIDALPPMQDTSERNYLGASEIGDPCARKLWLRFHKYVAQEQFSSRMLRLFHRGQREEGYFEMYLRETGFLIIENCFSQKRFVDGFFSGAGDGVVDKVARYACEYKTHSAKSFATLEVGKLESKFPKHFSQCQINAKKFGCVGTIYLAVNKDNDELFCDVIMLDEKKCQEIEAKAEYITMSDKPPPRIASKPTAFDCKFCHAKDVCWGFELPRVHCRNCTSATKHREYGSFGCDKIEKGRDVVARMQNDPLPESGSCSSHSFNPWAMQDMFNYQPIEFHPKERAVTYKKPDGTEIINGAAPFGIESKDMTI